MKVIIAGTRSFFDYSTLLKAIKDSGWEEEITEVVCGDAPGVDTMGARWATEHNIKIKHFPAKWSDIKVKGAVIAENKYGKYNKKAGFDRNEKMGKYADALIAVIKDNSRGTTQMIEFMRALGKKTYVWEV